MSYKNRSKNNNQFFIDHSWTGLCSLCFDEIAEFNGSNEYGKPIISKFKNNVKVIEVLLSDGSKMSISLCSDCYENISDIDFDSLTNNEINGWKKEISLLNKWTEEKKSNYLEKYSKIKIISLNK